MVNSGVGTPVKKRGKVMIQENQHLLNRLNIALDGLLVFLSFLMGYWLRFYVLPGGVSVMPFRAYLAAAAALIPLHLFTFSIMGLYESHRSIRLYQELGRLFWANALDFVLLQMGFFLMKDVHFSRLALGIFFILVNTSLGLKRIVLRKFLHRVRILGYNAKKVLIIGSGAVAKDYWKELCRSPELGFQVVGYVSERPDWKEIPYLGSFPRLGELLDQLKPDEAVAGLDMDEYAQMPRIIQACENSGTKLSLIPFYAQYMPAHPQFDSINGLPIINLRRIPLDNLGNAFLKRTMDVVGALALIVLTSPVMLFAAIGVKLSSPGPVIFRQKRVGLNKREFYMYKFRSMRVNDQSETRWSSNIDDRKTAFGAFIRKCSIDELPQFFNVLKGDMSLVGPRPEIPHFVEQFKEEIPLYMVKHQVRPGITGWAQVNGLRGDTSIEERIRHDIFYIENWSLLLDVKILLMTLWKGIINKEKLR